MDAAKPAPRTSKSVPAAAKPSGRGKPGRPQGRKPVEVHPATAGDWIRGARLQTLALAIAPVAAGTGAAALLMDAPWSHWVRALLCLAVAVCLQLGVNFANDYSDGIRGTDSRRDGPMRLVGSGRATPRAVRTVALVFFGLAAVAGLILAWRSGFWWLIAVGAVCIAGAWFYTGGKRPYGYAALGELSVFVFFGLVATVGTMFVQVGTVSLEGWLGGVAVGLLACSVLMVANLRDRDKDRTAGKRTLSVLIGTTASRVVYVVLLLAPFGILAVFTLLYDTAGYVYFALMPALPAAIIGITGRSPAEFVLAMRLSLLTALVFGLGLGAALAF